MSHKYYKLKYLSVRRKLKVFVKLAVEEEIKIKWEVAVSLTFEPVDIQARCYKQHILKWNANLYMQKRYWNTNPFQSSAGKKNQQILRPRETFVWFISTK